MRIGAVITAAGRSSRMGSFKPLLKIGRLTAAEHVIQNFHAAGINDIVLVTGYRAQELEKNLKRPGLVFLRNDGYKSNEMFDSVKIGLDYQKSKCDKIFISPVDIPLFMTDTVKVLLKCNADIGIPVYKGKTGHPIILNNAAASKILQYSGSGGLRDAILSLSLEVDHIETEDHAMLYDMNTQADYAGILKLYSGQSGESEK